MGYEKLNARRTEWEWLLDRIFEQGKSLSALDRCIGQEIKELGKPAFRHQIVLGLPEAIRGQKDWGEIDGREMDFSKEEDQIAATNGTSGSWSNVSRPPNTSTWNSRASTGSLRTPTTARSSPFR